MDCDMPIHRASLVKVGLPQLRVKRWRKTWEIIMPERSQCRVVSWVLGLWAVIKGKGTVVVRVVSVFVYVCMCVQGGGSS